MANWHGFERECPELAARVRTFFDAYRHKTMATLRKDGSPRISGIEVQFEDGEALIGMAADSIKARDLVRDSRIAIHSGSADPPEDPTQWPGDAKLAGRALPVADPGQPDAPPTRFRIDITEVSTVRVGDPPDHLIVESWHEGRGYRLRKRT